MTNTKVWLITGASSGIGLEIAKCALSAGNKVVATGRNADKVAKALGTNSEDLLVLQMDVTNIEEINTALDAVMEKFGTVDVLVNNAGSFYAGYFEELSQAQIERQFAVNVFGPMNVTRAILPVMRSNRAGHVITISSTAGLVGYELCTAYAGSKFALEGWMDSLQLEVSQFGINTTIVNPGFFRTNLLEPSSTIWNELNVADYAERIAILRPGWQAMSGTQGGDPAKLAEGLLTIASEVKPPKRWIAGADALAETDRKIKELQDEANSHRELSSSLAIDK
ncbi:D-beta-hydroxybutyrate dehydrogenase [Elizabethkingia miricola]|nr:D-beta-hydroxybutyrate dehydrogenase [Elizabethkingia miricola]